MIKFKNIPSGKYTARIAKMDSDIIIGEQVVDISYRKNSFDFFIDGSESGLKGMLDWKREKPIESLVKKKKI